MAIRLASVCQPQLRQVAQLWHPRNDRDPRHRWLRATLAASAKAATR